MDGRLSSTKIFMFKVTVVFRQRQEPKKDGDKSLKKHVDETHAKFCPGTVVCEVYGP